MKEKLRTTVPVRITDSMLDQIKASAEKLDLSEQDTFRLLLKIGLACLERTGYDIPEKIAAEALEK